jgi:signal transduction histidine kinase
MVDNAARHSPTGSCVSLASRVEGGYLTIEVADSGPGIHPEELPHIFDRFYQVKNRRSRKKGGAGLGLSIARTIVAAHGGGITAESTLGAGTRMTIRLPLAAPPEATEEPVPDPQRMAVRQ